MLEALLAALPDGILSVDAEGRLATLNPAARELLPGELSEGDRLAEAVPALAPLLARAVEEPLRGSVLLGGSPVEVRGAPLPAGGAVLSLRPPGQLDRRAHEAAEASRWASLAAGLAHELRNPLAGIEGAATLLARSVEGELAPLAEVVTKESRRIEGLVTGLMDLARPRPPEPRPTDLHRLLEEVLRLTEASLPAGLRIERRFDPSLPPLEVDPEHLTQVLHNLLRNAVEVLAPAGEGRITVSTGVALGLRSGPPHARRSMARLVVRDSGPGFDPRVLEQPFTPFVTTKPSGTGLGLALCRRLIEAQQGLIELANDPAGGARVQLVLPLSAQP
ncbi:MAG: ATP-binding protein [Deltaproteobacteria bacterium]|nr:ATP-binding protein [Deltaproteobacteria bacterium]